MHIAIFLHIFAADRQSSPPSSSSSSSSPAVSCVLALGVNISNYLVLGKTSPLTYQVLGHLKTILILVLGFVTFNKTIDFRNVIGIVIAMVGVVAYTEVRRNQANAAAAAAASPGQSGSSNNKV